MTNDEKKVQGHLSISTPEIARKVLKAPYGATEVLLFEALIGLKFILTDVKNNKAQSYYESYGFKAFKGR
jgi:hypothetical protein